jgi:hypothetical protein
VSPLLVDKIVTKCTNTLSDKICDATLGGDGLNDYSEGIKHSRGAAVDVALAHL